VDVGVAEALGVDDAVADGEAVAVLVDSARHPTRLNKITMVAITAAERDRRAANRPESLRRGITFIN